MMNVMLACINLNSLQIDCFSGYQELGIQEIRCIGTLCFNSSFIWSENLYGGSGSFHRSPTTTTYRGLYGGLDP